MALCSNRPEGFGPISRMYSHSLTSCFLDTILIPLCTWLYLLAIIKLVVISTLIKPQKRKSLGDGVFYTDVALGVPSSGAPVGSKPGRRPSRMRFVVIILYYLLLVAQFLMCVLEMVRLALAHLGIGLLPFTLVSVVVAGTLRFSKGFHNRIRGWRWANLGIWIALAVANGVKLSAEHKEGIHERKGTKYPVVDEFTDVAVMIGVYVAIGILEVCLRS